MSKDEIFNLITGHVVEILPELEEHKFEYSDQLKMLGANSLDRAEIVMMTLESLELEIPRVELFGATNIGELTELLYAKLK